MLTIATYDKSYIFVCNYGIVSSPNVTSTCHPRKKKFEIQYIWFAVYLLTALHKTTPDDSPHIVSQAH